MQHQLSCEQVIALLTFYTEDKLSKKYEYLARIDEEVNIINETIKEIQMDHKDWYVE